MTETSQILHLDAFRKVSSPLMAAQPSTLPPEMKNDYYQGMLRAFRGAYNRVWTGLAFQLGMQANFHDYPMHRIVFEVFGGDYKEFPKLVTGELSGEVHIAHGLHGFLRQTIRLMDNGQIMVHPPFCKSFGMVSGPDPVYADSLSRHKIAQGDRLVLG